MKDNDINKVAMVLFNYPGEFSVIDISDAIRNAVKKQEEYNLSEIEKLKFENKLLQNRIDVADEMLTELVEQIGNGSGVAPLRYAVNYTIRELRGVPR